MAYRDPSHGMVVGRCVAPRLAGAQAHRQIIQRDPGVETARRGSVRADNDACRTVARDCIGRQVDVFHGAELQLGRQRQPELETARTTGVAWTAGVPRAMSRLEPFNAAGRHGARGSV